MKYYRVIVDTNNKMYNEDNEWYNGVDGYKQ